MNNTLIIGAGNIGSALVHKCAQHNDVLGDICLASRTPAKCERAIRKVHEMDNLADKRRKLYPAQIDTRDPHRLAGLITDTRSSIVINVAPPHCNLAIMEACLETGAHYIDTAVYEKQDTLNDKAPWYGNHQWPLRPRFAEQKLTGILGMGFDPGAVNAFCAWVHKHHIDTIESIDIMDVNAGRHDRFFATNFDPMVNLREVMEDGIYWENGRWVRIPPHSRSRTVDFPVVGNHRVYSMGHDEVHSLPLHIPAQRIEFWMGFSEHYLRCFSMLRDMGFLDNKPVEINGAEATPLEMVKAVLPEPAELAAEYTGKTCIGCLIKGTGEGREKELFIYNVCDHEDCYQEVGCQAISYTTAVPAATAAILIAGGQWNVGRLVNVEELDPDPFMELMPKVGLSWEMVPGPL